MASVFHEGELAMQARLGTQVMAARIGTGIRNIVPSAAQSFLEAQPLAIASSVSQTGQVWASILSRQPGFIQMANENLIRVEPSFVVGDPLIENIQANGTIGLLLIEFATRKRIRLNGQAEIDADGKLWIETTQVWSNCPKYIQARELVSEATSNPGLPTSHRGQQLSRTQTSWIETADTFFMASYHPKSGADASHRGGQPGFVRVVNQTELLFPDYAGNRMFQTLGNLLINPNAGLLFVDFDTGSILQLTGKTHILWEEQYTAQFVGAERVVQFQVEQIIETTGAIPLRWQFLDYSSHNPL